MFRNGILVTVVHVLTLFLQKGTAERHLACTEWADVGILDDTTEISSTLFTIAGLKQFTACPLKEYFEIQNTSVILKRSLTHYCAHPQCQFICENPSFGLLHANLNVQIQRLWNYTIKFIQEGYQIKVTENTPYNTNILSNGIKTEIKECRIGDLGPEIRPIFRLIQNPYDLFAWKAQTSNDSLTVNRTIDYESIQNVTLILEAALKGTTVTGKEFSKDTTALEILIEDIDDRPPKFQYHRYTVYIQENNNTIHTPLNITPDRIYAYDMDRGIDEEIVYSIEASKYSGLFNINSSTGNVYVTGTLDRENIDSYLITIKAAQKDKRYSTATATLHVIVTDVDDNLPVFNDTTYYSATISEHSATGSYITTVTATDADSGINAKFTYKLLNESVPVLIDINKGIIRVKNQSEFDRETYRDGIKLLVETVTHDNRTGQNTATVTINLYDINDNNPQFTEPLYYFTVDNSSKGSYVGSVNATDKDKGPNAHVTYEFMAGTQSSSDCQDDKAGDFPFKIDTVSGNISVTSSFVVLCKRYRTFIKACDNPVVTDNRRCAVVEVTISSSNATNSTQMSEISQVLNITENSGIGTIVGKLNRLGSKYDYRGDTSFAIKSSGLLETTSPLDRETQDIYEAFVEVKDLSGQTLSRINLTINILDVNDNPPSFEKDAYSFEIPSGMRQGMELGRLWANDSDLGANGQVSYFIKKNGDSAVFSVNSSTGVIYLESVSELNKDIYYVLVAAEDNGNPRLESVAAVYISKVGTDNFTIPLTTPLTPDEIRTRKRQLEKNMSDLLALVISITTVNASADPENSKIKSVIYLAGKTNTSAPVSKAELQRVLLKHYEAVRALYYQPVQESPNQSTNNGLGAPEIALIVMGAVILIGAIVAIIIINKQFNSHKKYRRLYENLTRNSSIYESQEIKINLDDETSDYNGSLNTQDLEQTEAKAVEVPPSAVNPVYNAAHTSENDSGNISDLNQDNGEEVNEVQRTRTNSEQALESLHRLSDMLDKEDSETGLHNDNSGTLNPESGELINPPLIDETMDTSAFLKDTDSKLSSLDQPSKETDEQSDIGNGNAASSQPNPDYDVKQVRFSTEVLDTDDNKLEPLKENEGGRKLPKRITTEENTNIDNKSDKEQNAFDVEYNDNQQVDLNETVLNPDQGTDEPGWEEEEINIPNNLVNLDDIEKSELPISNEASTHL